ncbi:hypothetical protein ACVR0S_09515 [Streptococcus dentapri]|uniref:Pre-toxin TG domain-containing protein n=1 Tax=Streptococcus dentapri TaxID=573564 RepID=A0ABV8D2Z8_9STRE
MNELTGDARLAKQFWAHTGKEIRQAFKEDPAKATGRAAFEIGMLVLPWVKAGEAGEAANLASKAAEGTEALNDLDKAAEGARVLEGLSEVAGFGDELTNAGKLRSFEEGMQELYTAARAAAEPVGPVQGVAGTVGEQLQDLGSALRYGPELATAGGDISVAAETGESLSTLGQVQEISRAGAEEVGSVAGKLDEAGDLGRAEEVTGSSANPHWEGTQWESHMDDLHTNMLANNRPVTSEVHSMDEIAQQKVLHQLDTGEVQLSTNLAKGNYGEIVQDEYYRQFGYERISKDMVTSLDSPGHQGIDGVYYNPDGHPPYIISEAKYNTARLSKGLADGTDQMDIDWIDNRLDDAISEEHAIKIRKSMLSGDGDVQSNLFNVKANGDITINQLNDAAQKMK